MLTNADLAEINDALGSVRVFIERLAGVPDFAEIGPPGPEEFEPILRLLRATQERVWAARSKDPLIIALEEVGILGRNLVAHIGSRGDTVSVLLLPNAERLVERADAALLLARAQRGTERP